MEGTGIASWLGLRIKNTLLRLNMLGTTGRKYKSVPVRVYMGGNLKMGKVRSTLECVSKMPSQTSMFGC